MRAMRGSVAGLLVLVLAQPGAAQDTEVVSVDSAGVLGNSFSGFVGVAYAQSGGDEVVYFDSLATNLVANDGNGKGDIFRRFVSKGLTERVVMGLNGAEPDDHSTSVVCTPNGDVVAFASSATNLVKGDLNGVVDVFVLDLTTGILERVSVDDSENEADNSSTATGISADGNLVLFVSSATNLVKGDTNVKPDIFVRDRAAGTTTCASLDLSDVPAGAFGSGPSSISSDGRYVAFDSSNPNLILNDTNGQADVFLRDLVSKTTIRVSVNAGGFELNDESFTPSLAPDAQWVTFQSRATNLLREADGTFLHAFAKDLTTGAIHLLSRGFHGDAANSNTLGSRFFYHPTSKGIEPAAVISSGASDLVRNDVKVGFEQEIVTTRFLARANQLLRLQPDGSPSALESSHDNFAPSPDGRHVAFSNEASDLIAKDTNDVLDVFVRELRWVTFEEFGDGLAGSGGYVPHLSGIGGGCKAEAWSVDLTDGPGAAIGHLWVGAGTTDLPLFGGHFYVDFLQLVLVLPIVLDGFAGVAGDGEFHIAGADVAAFGGATVYLQCTLLDAGAPRNISLSNAVSLTIE